MSDLTPTHSIHSLLAHTDWLRALARQLVADASRVEDVVQETWLAALQSPPRDPHAIRPWLARVARRLAGKQGIRERARSAREQRVARPELALSTAEVVERAQTQQMLVDLVLGLEEPYRSTLLLHYFEDLNFEEIAVREGAPASTIRNRSRRGLEKLRAELDRRHGGDGKTWISALLGIAGPMNPGVTTAVSNGADSGSLIGATSRRSLGLSGKAAVVLLGAVSIAWIVAGSREGGARPVEQGAARGAVPLERSREAALAVSTPSSGTRAANTVPDPSETESSADPEIAEPGTIELRVTRDGVPVQRGEVVLMDRDDAERVWLPADPSPVASRTARLDAAGCARFVRVDPGTYQLGYVTPAGLVHQRGLTLREGARSARLELRLGSASVHGQVFTPAGEPLEGARVHLTFQPRDGPEHEETIQFHRPSVDDRFETDVESARGFASMRFAQDGLTDHIGCHTIVATRADGTFWVEGAPRGFVTIAVATAGGSRLESLWIEDGGVHEVDFGRPLELPRVTGRIRTATGEVVSNRGSVREPGQVHFYRVGTRSERNHAYDDEGRFDLALETGTYEVRFSSPTAGGEVSFGEVDVTEAGLSIDFTLPGATLDVVAPRDASVLFLLSKPDPLGYSARVDEAGRARIYGVQAGEYELFAVGGKKLGEVVIAGEGLSVQRFDTAE